MSTARGRSYCTPTADRSLYHKGEGLREACQDLGEVSENLGEVGEDLSEAGEVAGEFHAQTVIHQIHVFFTQIPARWNSLTQLAQG